MMPVVFFLVRLKPGVDPAAYERWFRERDYPTAGKFPSVVSYNNHRLAGQAHRHQQELAGQSREADAHYDYLEVVQINDLEAYRRDARSPAANKLRTEILEFIDPADNFVGEVLSPTT